MFMIDLGLPSYYSIIDVSPSASQAEIRDARDRKGKELKEKLNATRDSEERKKIEERLKEINAAGDTLASPERREEYDQNNAHLKYFTMQRVAAPMFFEKTDRLYVLHRAITDFLTAQKVVLPPLSDMEQEDFSVDETPNELLDNLLR